MNYRHGFHAGNHADVFKHVAWLGLIDALQRKPGGMFLLDTHAAAGCYDLEADEASRTGEWHGGIGRLRGVAVKHELLVRYRGMIAEDLTANRYPGSALLSARCLREQDRLAACEIQSDEAARLRGVLQPYRATVHQRDGYEALKALLPPSERRGAVLIDPPFEAQRAEFDVVFAALRNALTRWPQASYALWYPIKQSAALRPVWRSALSLSCKTMLRVECLIRNDESPLRLNGSGMLVVNPPWQWDQTISAAMAELAPLLDEGGGRWQLTWMKQEQPA